MKMMKLHHIALLIGAAILATACGGGKKEAKEPDKTLVRVAEAGSWEVEDLAEYTATIEPYYKNSITPAVSARIDQILVDVGAYVRKGQLLVRMDPTQYNTAAVQLATLEMDYSRTKAVYEAGGASKQQLDQIETQLKVAQESTKNLATNIEFRSPIDGVVTERNYEAGDFFGMNPAAILKVEQISRLKITAGVSEQYFPEVKLGQKVDIRVDLYPDQEFTGTISLIYPTIDPASRTFKVEVSVPNSGGKLRPGMFARTALKLGKHEGVQVPDLGVSKQMGTNESYAFVYKDGKVYRRTVTVGRHIGTMVDILSGIQAGEQVVVSGASRLLDEQEVDLAGEQAKTVAQDTAKTE